MKSVGIFMYYGVKRLSPKNYSIVVSLEPSIILYTMEYLANIWDLKDKITIKACQKNISQSKQVISY